MNDNPILPFVASTRSPDPAPERARWFLFQGDQLIVSKRQDAVSIPLGADPTDLGLGPIRTQYLGYLADAGGPLHCYSGEIDPSADLPNGYVALDLRQLFPHLDAMDIALAGRAKQIVHWDRDHQYCGRCGVSMEALDYERAKRCPDCKLTSYPRISPAVIVAVTRRFPDGERILLARNHRYPEGRYSVIAGFVEPGESLEAAVRREVHEEVGVQVQNIRYFGSQPWPFPNSLMVGFTAEYAGGDIRLEEEELADARWFAADDLPQVPPKISIARQLIDRFVRKNGGDPGDVEDWRLR